MMSGRNSAPNLPQLTSNPSKSTEMTGPTTTTKSRKALFISTYLCLCICRPFIKERGTHTTKKRNKWNEKKMNQQLLIYIHIERKAWDNWFPTAPSALIILSPFKANNNPPSGASLLFIIVHYYHYFDLFPYYHCYRLDVGIIVTEFLIIDCTFQPDSLESS